MPSFHHSFAKYCLPAAASSRALSAFGSLGAASGAAGGGVVATAIAASCTTACCTGAAAGERCRYHAAAPPPASTISSSATSGARELGAVGRVTCSELPTVIGIIADGSLPAAGNTAVLSAAVRPPSAASSASDIATADGYRSAGAFFSARATTPSSAP